MRDDVAAQRVRGDRDDLVARAPARDTLAHRGDDPRALEAQGHRAVGLRREETEREQDVPEVEAGGRDLDLDLARRGPRALGGPEDEVLQDAGRRRLQAEGRDGPGRLDSHEGRARGRRFGRETGQAGHMSRRAAPGHLRLAIVGIELIDQRAGQLGGTGGVQVHAGAAELGMLVRDRAAQSPEERRAEGHGPVPGCDGLRALAHQPQSRLVRASRERERLHRVERAQARLVARGLQRRQRRRPVPGLV